MHAQDPLTVVPVLAPGVRCVKEPGGPLYVLREQQRFVVDEALYAQLLAEVDGRRTTGELLAALGGEHDLDTASVALSDLLARGYVVDGARGASHEADSAWWGAAIDRAAPADERPTVQVIQAADKALSALPEHLSRMGFTLSERAELCVVVVDDYLDPRLELVVRQHGGYAAPPRLLVPLKASGHTLWLGPALFAERGDPCWVCLKHGLERNRPVERYLQQSAADASAPLPAASAVSLPESLELAASFAAIALAHAAFDPKQLEALRQHVLTLTLPRFERTWHRVGKRPQCPGCGDPRALRAQLAAPVTLERRLRLRGMSGGHRVGTPEQLLARCEPLVSPITGVIARAGAVPGKCHPLRLVYGSSYFVCPAPGEARDRRSAFSRPALGKGRTVAQAHASALAEALERYAAHWSGDELTFRASARDLGERAIGPAQLLHFSASQYDARSADGSADPRHTAPLAYDPTRTIAWTPAWSLRDHQRRYLPASFVWNHMPVASDERVCSFDPNGCAAGGCREEAILQGLFELVERDAVALWWHNRLTCRGLDLASFDDTYLTDVRAHYAALGWQLWALELPHDLQIPVVAAVAFHEQSGRFIVGFGCHLDPSLALERAVTEAHQVFDPDPAQRTPWTLADLGGHRFVWPDPQQPLRMGRELRRELDDDLSQEVCACVARLAARGLDTIVLDYTRPDLLLHTVRVVAPGLRHFWRRLGPGRLYDVPVELGLRSEPLAEHALNPLALEL